MTVIYFVQASRRKASTCPLCKASFICITKVEDAVSADQKIYSQSIPHDSLNTDLYILPDETHRPGNVTTSSISANFMSCYRSIHAPFFYLLFSISFLFSVIYCSHQQQSVVDVRAENLRIFLSDAISVRFDVFIRTASIPHCFPGHASSARISKCFTFTPVSLIPTNFYVYIFFFFFLLIPFYEKC